MNKIILALAFLVGSIASAAAACTGPAVMHDFPGTAFNMSLATNASDGNCSSNMTLVGTLPAYTSIPAFKIDQTTPGTTNLVAAGQNGTWNVTNISGTVSLPTGASTAANQSTANTSLASIAASAATTATNTGSAIPAQSSTIPIGGTSLCDGANGTTNPCTTAATVKVASTPAAAADKGLVATISPNYPSKGGVGVVNGGSTYQAVAASATATVLQSSTGAIGDYLSHCVIYPTSTSPGVVTVFDNTNTAATSAILFAGGATSTSNLTPISVPVGAVSIAGAWKVTTGANVSVVCYGKFS